MIPNYVKNHLFIYFKGIGAVLLLCASIGVFFYFVNSSILVQQGSSRVVVSIKSDTPVELALKSIDSGNLKQALDHVDNIANGDFSDEIKRYFYNFKQYYQYKKVEGTIDTFFFISESQCLVDFLVKDVNTSEVNARLLAEVVPYFFIKEYDQYERNRISLYDKYIKAFTPRNELSPKCADVVCLFVKVSYKENKKNDDSLKLRLREIREYRTQFENYLSEESGIFTRQRNYLSEAYMFMQNKVNRPLNISTSFPRYNF